jgi:SEC-C motif/Uncharacterised protein family (UPF0149)
MNTPLNVTLPDLPSIDEEAMTTWTDDDAQAYNDVLMHPALAEGPTPELLEGFITGSAISPFDGLAEDLLKPLFEVYEMDWAMLPTDLREPLITWTQKRMDAILDGLDQEIAMATGRKPQPAEGSSATGESFFLPMLTDWDEVAKNLISSADTTAQAATGDNAETPVLPKMAELWARGMMLAFAVWQDNQWQLLDKRLRKDLPKLHAPMERLCAEGKQAVTESRTRLKLFDDCMVSIYELYTMSQQFYERLAVTPAPITRTDVPGRNDPCSCGSGKKYKKCCGA